MIEITDILDAEQHIEGLKGVIFDLDDTLYSEKEYIRSGYKAVAPVSYTHLDVYKRQCI